jgi:hypothetical protein
MSERVESAGSRVVVFEYDVLFRDMVELGKLELKEAKVVVKEVR